MSGIKKILSGLNFLSVYIIALVIINTVMLFLPLTGVFGYESSAINAIFTVILTGFYTIPILKLLIDSVLKQEEFFRRILTAALLFLAIPIVISVSHSLLTINCSLKDGFAFYIVITFPSVLLGFFFAVFAVSISKKFPRLVFVFISLIVLSIPLLEFYYNPQVYFYNPIFGYFPGTIYDEGLSVSTKLILYRTINSLFFGSSGFLILFAILKKSRIFKYTVIFLSISIAVLFYYFSPLLGFSTTFSYLEKKLGCKVITRHFVIYYPVELNPTKVESLILYHEYYYTRLAEFFGYKFNNKLKSYIFVSDEQKKELFGSANADVAKPWLRSTFITQDNYNKTLKHELAHSFSAKFGTGLLKVASGLNPFLIEGIAVAADPVYDENNIDYLAASAYSNGYKINIGKMLSGFGFFTGASSTSYIYAGSFVKFLINSYGMNKFIKLYRGNDFYDAYTIQLKDAEKRYYNFLDSLIVENSKNQADYYFGRKSIFVKVCPRYVSDRLQKGWEEYARNNFLPAKLIFSKILEKTDNYSAVIGYSECLAKTNQRTAAEKLISGATGKFKNTAYYYTLELQEADLAAENSRFIKADSIYRNLCTQNPSRYLYTLANLRIALLSDTSSIKIYLEGSDFDKYQILKKLNFENYSYSSFPVLINLSRALKENYKLFLANFKKTLNVDSYLKSYSVYRLSGYMLDNLDYANARKIAAMALWQNDDKNFLFLANENYKMCDWFYRFHAATLNNCIYENK